jgi:hypothetical protein
MTGILTKAWYPTPTSMQLRHSLGNEHVAVLGLQPPPLLSLPKQQRQHRAVVELGKELDANLPHQLWVCT